MRCQTENDFPKVEKSRRKIGKESSTRKREREREIKKRDEDKENRAICIREMR